jgi:hypothetical protein
VRMEQGSRYNAVRAQSERPSSITKGRKYNEAVGTTQLGIEGHSRIRSTSLSAISLYLNRRLCSQAVHDLNAVNRCT